MNTHTQKLNTFQTYRKINKSNNCTLIQLPIPSARSSCVCVCGCGCGCMVERTFFVHAKSFVVFTFLGQFFCHSFCSMSFKEFYCFNCSICSLHVDLFRHWRLAYVFHFGQTFLPTCDRVKTVINVESTTICIHKHVARTEKMFQTCLQCLLTFPKPDERKRRRKKNTSFNFLVCVCNCKINVKLNV